MIILGIKIIKLPIMEKIKLNHLKQNFHLKLIILLLIRYYVLIILILQIIQVILFHLNHLNDSKILLLKF